MSFSESTKRILDQIRNSSDGWHSEIEATEEEIALFESEFDPLYILDVEETDDDVYYVTLGTDWTIGETLIELKEKYPELTVELNKDYSLSKTDSLFYGGIVCQVGYNNLVVAVETEGIIQLLANDHLGKEFFSFKDDSNSGRLNSILDEELGITDDEELEEFLELERVNITNHNYFSFNLYEKNLNGDLILLNLNDFEHTTSNTFNFVDEIDGLIEDLQRVVQKSKQMNLDL